MTSSDSFCFWKRCFFGNGGSSCGSSWFLNLFWLGCWRLFRVGGGGFFVGLFGNGASLFVAVAFDFFEEEKEEDLVSFILLSKD